MADFIQDEGGESIFDEAGEGVEAILLTSVASILTRPVLLHRNVLEQLMPVDLAGPVHAKDVALEGSYLDVASVSAEAMLANAFAASAMELLPDWERLYALRHAPEATASDRRIAVLNRKRARGGLSRRYFIDLAAASGYAIEIYEEADWQWRVHVLSSPDFLEYFRAEESCAEEYLLEFGTPALEELIIDLKPAHTFVYFSYA